MYTNFTVCGLNVIYMFFRHYILIHVYLHFIYSFTFIYYLYLILFKAFIILHSPYVYNTYIHPNIYIFIVIKSNPFFSSSTQFHLTLSFILQIFNLSTFLLYFYYVRISNFNNISLKNFSSSYTSKRIKISNLNDSIMT